MAALRTSRRTTKLTPDPITGLKTHDVWVFEINPEGQRMPLSDLQADIIKEWWSDCHENRKHLIVDAYVATKKQLADTARICDALKGVLADDSRRTIVLFRANKRQFITYEAKIGDCYDLLTTLCVNELCRR